MTDIELVQACQDLLDSKRHPTTQEVYRLACAYENLGNAFGELKPALDEYNWDNATIQICIDHAKKPESVLLGKILLLLDIDQRKGLWTCEDDIE